MGRLSIETNENKGQIKANTILDIVVFLFILALFVFENAAYSSLFSFIQILFVGLILLVALQRKTITVIPVHLWLGVFLVFTLCLELVHINSWGQSALQIIFKNSIRGVCLSLYLSFGANLKKVIKYIAFSGFICALFLFSEFVAAGLDYSSLRYASNDRIGAEIAGGNVNIVALNMCFSFSAWLYLAKDCNGKRNKLICVVCMIAVGGASLLTGTRKILLFFLVVYMINTFMHGKKAIKKIWITIFVVLVAYYCILNVEPLYYLVGHKVDFWSGSNTTALYNKSDAIRENLIANGMTLFFNNPIFGVGFGRISYLLGTYAHNNFVEILASSGVIGFMIYYSAYAYIAYISNHYRKQSGLALYVFSSIIGMLVIEYFQVTYLYGMPLVFIVLGFSCCKEFRSNKAERN